MLGNKYAGKPHPSRDSNRRRRDDYPKNQLRLSGYFITSLERTCDTYSTSVHLKASTLGCYCLDGPPKILRRLRNTSRRTGIARGYSCLPAAGGKTSLKMRETCFNRPRLLGRSPALVLLLVDIPQWRLLLGKMVFHSVNNWTYIVCQSSAAKAG
jgi:hypothetical protein